METQKVNIDGLVVWISLFHPKFEIEGKVYQSTKYVIYYNFYEPSNNYYGKLVCQEDRSYPLWCDNMEGAILTVRYQLIQFMIAIRE
jgi:hypothetical protein